jgi:hypothetical protein
MQKSGFAGRAPSKLMIIASIWAGVILDILDRTLFLGGFTKSTHREARHRNIESVKGSRGMLNVR